MKSARKGVRGLGLQDGLADKVHGKEGDHHGQHGHGPNQCEVVDQVAAKADAKPQPSAVDPVLQHPYACTSQCDEPQVKIVGESIHGKDREQESGSSDERKRQGYADIRATLHEQKCPGEDRHQDGRGEEQIAQPVRSEREPARDWTHRSQHCDQGRNVTETPPVGRCIRLAGVALRGVAHSAASQPIGRELAPIPGDLRPQVRPCPRKNPGDGGKVALVGFPVPPRLRQRFPSPPKGQRPCLLQGINKVAPPIAQV